MLIPPRILRSQFDDTPGAMLPLTAREMARKDRIVLCARIAMARHGRMAISMANLALGMNLSPASIRRLLPDMDAILGEILLRHLRAIHAAIHAVPRDAPNRLAAQRAAYLGATRTGLGGHTDSHVLLMRERQTLPPDILDHLEDVRQRIGQDLMGDLTGDPAVNELHVLNALALLDIPDIDHEQMEALLATLTANPGFRQSAPSDRELPTPEPFPEPPIEPRLTLVPPTPQRQPEPDDIWNPPPAPKNDFLSTLSARAGPG